MAVKFELDLKCGVPFYRQIIDRVKSAIATGELGPGDRLPTVRQLAGYLSINPNTVGRAYTELELTGLVKTQAGSGTFVGQREVRRDDVERQRLLDQLCQEFLSRVSTHGFTIDDVLDALSARKHS